jgi:hypothetical protein
MFRKRQENDSELLSKLSRPIVSEYDFWYATQAVTVSIDSVPPPRHFYLKVPFYLVFLTHNLSSNPELN